jgi:hypothetical protein
MWYRQCGCSALSQNAIMQLCGVNAGPFLSQTAEHYFTFGTVLSHSTGIISACLQMFNVSISTDLSRVI